jgi:hypothetical protein
VDEERNFCKGECGEEEEEFGWFGGEETEVVK